jgi:hypothetical protein
MSREAHWHMNASYHDDECCRCDGAMMLQAPRWCAVQNINVINDSVIGGMMMMSDDASTQREP